MPKILTYAAMVAMVAMTLLAALMPHANGETPAVKKAPAKKGGTRRAVPKKRPAGTARTSAASAANTASTARRGGKKAPVKRATTWRNRQMAPTPERYREIQAALVAKGYLKREEAGGPWNQTSVDALKNFQTGQNLDSTGKINSLSLIALGLGPKREATPPVSKPPDAQPPVEKPPGEQEPGQHW